ncbi:hypothetical protein Syun_007031 [Stephania yunnanensis]|uniref:CCHC-type domain-containing protein n=1 Tax=Stephania yunnanensis TaxID=152371 RepID=A0AAP0PZ13_9MAGN
MRLEDLIVRLRIKEDNKKNDNKNGDFPNETNANLLGGQIIKSSKKMKHSSDESNQFKGRANKFISSCFICKKHGHEAKDCNKWKRNKTQSKAHGGGHANFIEDELSKDVSNLNLFAVVFEANMVDNPQEWYIDIGATKHVCADKNMFSSYTLISGRNLFMSNSATLKIIGVGKVMLKMTSGKELTLNEVLHVLDIRKNLLFGSYLAKMDSKWFLNLISLYYLRIVYLWARGT